MHITDQLTNSFLLKKHLAIILLGIIFGLLIAYFISSSNALPELFFMITASLSGITNAYLLYGISLILDKFLPWQINEGGRLLLGIIVHFAAILLWSLFFVYILGVVFPDIVKFGTVYDQYSIKMGILLFIFALVYEIIYFALYSYYSFTTFQIETVRQERKQIELQLNALKSQLSPHFLFNSLSTISSLAFKDHKRAEFFIRKLAAMYNYTLQSYQYKLITLKEELKFVDSYLYLLENRFGTKLQCHIDVDKDLLQGKLPPLTLQILVENAVKHNTLEEEQPLTIRIVSNQKYVKVSNNITKKPKHVSSFEIGLKNINARYLLLHKEGIVVTKNSSFQVKVPVLL